MPGEVIRVAVVTGAARGIGLAIARMFLDRGDAVALLDIDAPALASAAAELAADHGDRVLQIPCDVSNPEQVRNAVAQAEQKFSRIDALVNNAGVAVFKPLTETSFEEWRHVMATNLDGVFLCSQACVAAMRKVGGGSIVNIASISGLRASTLRVAYGTSKAAIVHFTKQQAVELAMHGIRANAVAPGPVETAMAKKVHSAAIRKDYHDSVPLARYGTEEEIAAAVVFLCSAQASYVTGQVLAVDGGFDAAGVGLPTLRRQSGLE
ncbi:SDR family NAD(P)-dependent oxidoreductase [Ramlibacter sp. Leaf400]|uniref:SDR family NAD(P)-dependent oxidoreductase n=1 Tax=Ramlibacter sp. Leaf400 TaxID=1736365 RepID=UPI0006F94BDD|nr:SDR family oxidoreductase [Ramlibacter sp. Leaf400]KQT07552.1 3-oxoacyl-ACP reductase [Ramlibacter sp. Leaf400]